VRFRRAQLFDRKAHIIAYGLQPAYVGAINWLSGQLPYQLAFLHASFGLIMTRLFPRLVNRILRAVQGSLASGEGFQSALLMQAPQGKKLGRDITLHETVPLLPKPRQKDSTDLKRRLGTHVPPPDCRALLLYAT
jgi:hypothetical protein